MARTSSRVSGDIHPTSVSVGVSMSLTGAESRTRPLADNRFAAGASAPAREVRDTVDDARSDDRRRGCPGEATHRTRRQLPVHGDADHVRPRERVEHLRTTERRVRPVRRGVRPLRLQGRRARADAPARRRGALPPRSPVLDRRSELRPRLPHPAHEPGAAGAGRPARRAGRPHRRSPDGPQPPTVGGLRHRGPGERPLGAADEVPPRHHRRRLRRDDDEPAQRSHARRRPARREPGVGAGDGARATWSCSA